MREKPLSNTLLRPPSKDPQLLLNKTLLPGLRKLRFKCRNNIDSGMISVTHPDHHEAKLRGNWFNGVRSILALIVRYDFLKNDHALSREVREYVECLTENPVKDVLKIVDLPTDIETRIIQADRLIDRVLGCLEPDIKHHQIAINFEEKVRQCEMYRVPPDVRIKVGRAGFPSLKILAKGINKKCEHAVLAVLGACEHGDAAAQHAETLLSEVRALRRCFDEQYERLMK